VEDDLWHVLGFADQCIQLVREDVRGDMATVDDVSSDEVAVPNVYDDIVIARTLIAFDDLGEFLKKRGTV